MQQDMPLDKSDTPFSDQSGKVFNDYIQIMAKLKLFSRLVVSLLVVFFVASCEGQSYTLKERSAFLQEILSFKEELPYKIGETIAVTNLEVDNDFVEYTFQVNEEEWMEISLISDESIKNDRNLARVLGNCPSDITVQLIKYGIGFRSKYISAETGKLLFELEMSADKIKEIKDKVNSGEIQPYSLIEVTQIEISKMSFPVQVEEGIWMTSVYIEGNNVCYIASVEGEINPSDISNDDLKEMEEDIIEELKKSGLVIVHKEEILKENIHFIYVFKDSRGLEFARFDIGPNYFR